MKKIAIDPLCDPDIITELERTEKFGREKLAQAREKRPFCIVVCGMFSTGKSSLINALLGTSLPTGIFPVTKVVTKVRYGEQPRIVLKNLYEDSEWEVSEKIAGQIITEQGRDSQYKNYQIFIETPSEFLRNDVIIIDTPGMNDDPNRRLDDVTRTEIRNADFCIINFLCTKFAEEDEKKFLTEMQELTNGNFVSVLNCINLLTGGEDQLEDLEKRARYVLGEYGNERVGKGRYFRVDSKDKNDAYLDDLDKWLNTIVRNERRALQADTPLTMAYTELKRIKTVCDARIDKISETLQILRSENNMQVSKQQRQAKLDRNLFSDQIDSLAISERDELSMLFGATLRERLSKYRGSLHADSFVVNAKNCISELVLDYCRGLKERTTGPRGKFSGVAVSYSIQTEFRKCLEQFRVPEPEYQTRERGFLDLDRYTVGRYYRVYNDYAAAALHEAETVLLPILNLRIGEYFAALKTSAEESNSRIILGGYETDIDRLEVYMKKLSENSLNTLLVLHEVRELRDYLLDI